MDGSSLKNSGSAGGVEASDVQVEEREEVAQPHQHFEHPAEVIADHSLSKDEKIRALDALEQDARQLEIATAEGMDGGEDNRLKEVLEAKDALDLSPADLALAVVVQKLKSELPRTEGTEAHGLVIQAIEALEAANVAIAALDAA
jgi:hypothetical protein